jgi:PAS domain S-box-containing protein
MIMAEKINDIEKVIADEHNLRKLINSIDDPIWLVDAEYTIIECNNAFKKWVHHFIGKELDKGDQVLYNGLDKTYQDKFEMCYQLALKGRAFKSVEDMKVGNEVRYTTVSFHPVYNNEHQIIGVSCFARDMTEQRKHLLRIEEQNTALREIAFIESHKVRGPLATILGLEQLFNYEDSSDPINKEVIEGITKVSHDLDLIIREVVRRSTEIGLQP